MQENEQEKRHVEALYIRPNPNIASKLYAATAKRGMHFHLSRIDCPEVYQDSHVAVVQPRLGRSAYA